MLCFLLLLGCSNPTKERGVKKESNSSIRYASCLELDSISGGLTAHLIQPEQADTFKYFLSTDSTLTPTGYTFLSVPLTDLTVLSATQIGMLEKLGCISYVKAIADDRYIYNSALKNQVRKGKTALIGQFDNISIEKLIHSSSKAVLFSGFSGDFPQSAVLTKAGVQPIPVFDWKEQHPLGKAEWIKLIGYLVGKHREAFNYFNALESRYNQLKQSRQTKVGPTVICGNLTGDIWYTPAGESYHAKLLQDAGARYRYSSTNGIGSLSLSLEKVLKDNLTTEFWINPGIPHMKQLKAIHPLIGQFKSVKARKVFCYSHATNKYWELAAIEPDRVLSDFIQLFYNETTGKEKLYFYQKVSK